MDTSLTLRPHLRATLVLGVPLVGGHLAQFLIGLTDTLMLGWYGVDELAALVLGSSLFFVFFLTGSGFAWAVMPLVASYAEEGDQTMVRRATRMGLWLSGLFFILVLPVFLLTKPILVALGQDPALAEMAQTYLRIAGWGMLPGLAVMTLKSYLAALERTQVVLWVTVAAAVANALANYALIFGHFGA
ncbi:MAG: MATE family efflux transporter, partial [Paracoccaceae bacterium]